jgi:hypothetical protein
MTLSAQGGIAMPSRCSQPRPAAAGRDWPHSGTVLFRAVNRIQLAAWVAG